MRRVWRDETPGWPTDCGMPSPLGTASGKPISQTRREAVQQRDPLIEVLIAQVPFPTPRLRTESRNPWASRGARPAILIHVNAGPEGATAVDPLEDPHNDCNFRSVSRKSMWQAP